MPVLTLVFQQSYTNTSLLQKEGEGAYTLLSGGSIMVFSPRQPKGKGGCVPTLALCFVGKSFTLFFVQ